MLLGSVTEAETPSFRSMIDFVRPTERFSTLPDSSHGTLSDSETQTSQLASTTSSQLWAAVASVSRVLSVVNVISSGPGDRGKRTTRRC